MSKVKIKHNNLHKKKSLNLVISYGTETSKLAMVIIFGQYRTFDNITRLVIISRIAKIYKPKDEPPLLVFK